MKLTVFARVDFSDKSGLGHLYRSLALFECLVRDGWNVIIATSLQLPEGFIDKLPIKSFVMGAFISEQDDTLACHKWLELNSIKPDLVWVDHYHLDILFEASFSKICPVAALDDMKRQHSVHSWVVDYFPDRSPKDYSSHPNSKLLLGSKYMLFRRQFRETLNHVSSVKKGSLLIHFGGSDPDNYGLSILKVLHESIHPITSITWMGGAQEHLDFWVREDIKIKCINSTSNIVSLMNSHQLAIGAAGVGMWERLAIKLPSLVWKIALNQSDNFNIARQYHLIDTVELPPHINPSSWLEKLKLMSQWSRDALLPSLDSVGCNRILKEILPIGHRVKDHLQFYQYDAGLIDVLFHLQSIDGIRRWSRNKNPPSWSEHFSWSHHLIQSDTDMGWIIKYCDKTCGWLRLSLKSNTGYFEISLLVDPEYQGLGIGREIIEFAKTLKNKLCGFVFSENLPSISLFEKSGFSKDRDWYYWVS